MSRYNSKTIAVKKFSLLFIAIVMSCCAGDGARSLTTIDDISFRDPSVTAGNSGQARIHFTPSSRFLRIDSDGNDVYESSAFTLIVFMSSGVTYQTGSSKITDNLIGDVLFGNPDNRTPNSTGSCTDGRSYISYDFKDGEFDDPTQNIQPIFLKFGFVVAPTTTSGTIGVSSLNSNSTNPCSETVENSKAIIISKGV